VSIRNKLKEGFQGEIDGGDVNVKERQEKSPTKNSSHACKGRRKNTTGKGGGEERLPGLTWIIPLWAGENEVVQRVKGRTHSVQGKISVNSVGVSVS